MGFNSISSASWRKGIITQSIASYFGKKPAEEKNDQTVVTEASRNTSTSDAGGNGVLGDTTPPDQEKNAGKCWLKSEYA
jgi:hypothetical protein